MKTETTVTLPAGVSGQVLSRFIDWSDETRPQFVFQIEIAGPGGRDVFRYSGGILAFVTEETRKQVRTVQKGSSFNRPPFHGQEGLRFAECVSAILAGKNVRYSDDSHNGLARRALEWLLSQAAPTLPGILSCLVLDSSGCDGTFEEWAQELGYDEDSRKAEAVWNACRENSKKFRKVVGSLFDAIAEALQDY